MMIRQRRPVFSTRWIDTSILRQTKKTHQREEKNYRIPSRLGNQPFYNYDEAPTRRRNLPAVLCGASIIIGILFVGEITLLWISGLASPLSLDTTVADHKYVPVQRSSEDIYDVFHCPIHPPPQYPREYNILDVLGNWSIPDIQLLPSRTIHQGLCVFDYNITSQATIEEQVQTYQQAEVPFVVRNDPAILEAVHRWTRNNSAYLKSKLKGKLFEATLANTTHMAYFSVTEDNEIPAGFQPPTRFAPMTFDEWYQRAHHHRIGEEYAYLRLDACLEKKDCDATYLTDPHTFSDADFIYDDLRFFHPQESTPYIVDKDKPRGIQCRFGAPGLIAENHFDNERNYIAILGGERRYLLSHPRSCPHMYLYPQRHPYERHSMVNWSHVDGKRYPNFQYTTVNEVVLQAGDILYLPTFWFHHIVSLSSNYQCNTRSGYSVEYDQIIYDCGFLYDFPE